MSQVSDFPQLSQFCYVPELFRRFSGYLSIFGGVGGGVRLVGGGIITGPSMYIFLFVGHVWVCTVLIFCLLRCASVLTRLSKIFLVTPLKVPNFAIPARIEQF